MRTVSKELEALIHWQCDIVAWRLQGDELSSFIIDKMSRDDWTMPEIYLGASAEYLSLTEEEKRSLIEKTVKNPWVVGRSVK